MAYVPPFNGGRINASIGGNSTSGGGGYSNISTGTMYLMGGNNITLSQDANSITISGGNVAQSNQTLNFSASVGSNLTASGTFDARSMVLNAHGLSAGFSQSSIFLSAHTTYAASNHSHGDPTLNLTNLSGTTASASNGLTLSLSANPAQTNQTLSFLARTTNGGNTTLTTDGTFDARSMNVIAQGALYAGFSSSSLVLSAVTTYAASNHSHGNPTLNLTNLSGTTASASNGLTLSLSAAAPAAGAALSAGTQSVNTGTVKFADSNGISFGMSGSSQVTASYTVPTQSNQTLNFSASVGSYLTASGTFDARSMVLNAHGALSAGFSNSSVFMSAPATSSLAAAGIINISTNGSTITISAPGPISHWIHNSAAAYSSSTSAMVNTSVSLVRMLIPQNITFTRVDIPVSVSGATSATANTAAMALSAVGVIYSRNASTLNAIVGQSSTTTYSYASNTGVYASITGPRMLSFNLATTLSAGEYYLGFQMSSATSSVGTATTNLGWTLAPIHGTSYSVLPWQDMSAATNQTINLYQPLQGMNSVSISNTSQTHQQSQITQSGATAIRANLMVILRNN